MFNSNKFTNFSRAIYFVFSHQNSIFDTFESIISRHVPNTNFPYLQKEKIKSIWQRWSLQPSETSSLIKVSIISAINHLKFITIAACNDPTNSERNQCLTSDNFFKFSTQRRMKLFDFSEKKLFSIPSSLNLRPENSILLQNVRI